MEIRALTPEDHEASVRLSTEAFGSAPGWTPPPRPDVLPTDRHVVVAVDAAHTRRCHGTVRALLHHKMMIGKRRDLRKMGHHDHLRGRRQAR